MERPRFTNNEIYHVYNRGVEKRKIFLEEKDCFRFIYNLFEFNNSEPALNMNFYFNASPTNLQLAKKSKKELVEILCFCLMPNHYHLLLRQKVDGGITEFMRKIGTGYTNYFNIKNERVGPLFQGKFKAVHVEDQGHLLYLPHYIHLNPLDLVVPEWREQKKLDFEKALLFLEKYRWSSYLDYINKTNYPSVTQRDFILLNYGSPTSIVDYKQDMREWLENFDLETIQDVIIE